MPFANQFYSTTNFNGRAPAFRFVDGVARSGPTSSALSHQDRTTHHHPGLVKQAYSAWVTANPYARPQKWHLTAYFTYADLPHLPTVDYDPTLRKIVVPGGIYRSGKSRSRADDDEVLSPRGSRSPDEPEEHRNMLPSLSSLHSSVGARPLTPNVTRTHGARLPEDQRLIQMLNSRHIR